MWVPVGRYHNIGYHGYQYLFIYFFLVFLHLCPGEGVFCHVLTELSHLLPQSLVSSVQLPALSHVSSCLLLLLG